MTSLLTTPCNYETLEKLFQVLLEYGRDVPLPGARGNTFRLRPKKSIGARVYNYVEVEHVVGASPFRPKKFHMTEMDMFIRFMYTKVKKAELNKVYLRTLENNERLAA